jgi:hypothetical protein
MASMKGQWNEHGVLNKHWQTTDGKPDGGISNGIGFVISWQRGSLEAGRNGAFLLEVLSACRSQLEYYQTGQFASTENELALDNLKTAIAHLERRLDRSKTEGVLGTHDLDKVTVSAQDKSPWSKIINEGLQWDEVIPHLSAIQTDDLPLDNLYIRRVGWAESRASILVSVWLHAIGDFPSLAGAGDLETADWYIYTNNITPLAEDAGNDAIALPNKLLSVGLSLHQIGFKLSQFENQGIDLAQIYVSRWSWSNTSQAIAAYGWADTSAMFNDQGVKAEPSDWYIYLATDMIKPAIAVEVTEPGVTILPTEETPSCGLGPK